MDIVTWVTACAVGAQAGLFVPLGGRGTCDALPDVGAETRQMTTRPNVDWWAPHIAAAAQRFGVPAAWLGQVMRVESGGAPAATSSAGAVGLMQLMPDTYGDLAARYSLGDDPYDPPANIAAGAAYLREMVDRFGVPGGFAAYNAGPGRMADYLSRGRRVPAETERYVAQMIRAVSDVQPTNEWAPVGLANDAASGGEAQHGGDAIAQPVPSVRQRVAAGLQRGATMAPRSGALFVHPSSSGSAATVFDIEPRASRLPTGWQSVGKIDEGRGGALFVRLGRGEGRGPGMSGPR